MCGIVGMYACEGAPPHAPLWPGLVNHLRHRGPDDGGWWADGPYFLGHRRLSIVGLASGGQPMATMEADLVVTFNGEIYNYPELRIELERQGYRFRTDSDTEVLLHGYRAWGTGLPGRLTGMFAFALADRRDGSLFVARDRLGEKPLFLTRTANYVAFASELRPLTALPDLPRRLNLEALGGYLLLNYVPGQKSLLAGVERLPPGTWRLFTGRQEKSAQYWALPSAEIGGSHPPLADVVEECQARLDRAVRFTLRSDVPVGIFLSGGMDSSLVAESAMRQGRLNRAFCLDFSEKSHSEFAAAAAVANRYGLPLERITLSAEALRDFPQLVEHADDPLADSSALAVWTLARHAARLNKVVLGGDGGDELFGGYLTYRASRLHARVISRMPGPVRRALTWASAWIPTRETKVSFSYKLCRLLRACALPTGQAHFSWNGTWLPHEAARLVQAGTARAGVQSATADLLSRHGLTDRSDLLTLQRADLLEYLPNDILTKTDRMSMAHGLEVRAPLLEHELAAWALRLPERYKLGPGGELKTVLRAVARKVLGPEVADRPKEGFSIPIHQWTRGPAAEAIRDLLTPTAVRRLEVLDPQRVGEVVARHFAGRASLGFEVWGLAVLVAWHQTRVERVPSLPRLDVKRVHFARDRAVAA